MCSKLEGIFNHICVTTWTHMHEYICEWHGILIPKKFSNTWNHGWCNVMPPRWCGKKLSFLTKVWTPPSQTRPTHWKARGSEREQCMFDDEREIDSSYSFKFFLRVTCTNTTIMWKFGKISCVIWPFEDIWVIFKPFNDRNSNSNYIYMQRLTTTVWKIICVYLCES